MKKFVKWLSFAAVLTAIMALTACGGADDTTPTAADVSGTPVAPVETPAPGQEIDVEVDAADPRLAQHGLDENLRFLETQTISTVIWDRSHERMPDMSSNGWTDWMQAQLLEDHNINLEFVVVPRWEQQPFTTMLIGAGNAPDVTFHFGGLALTRTFAEMGAIMDIAPLLERYGDWLPNMYGFLGENVYYNVNPETGQNFAVSSRRTEIMRQNTFIREDWLNTLGMAPPTTLQEFEDALIAFRDNAELLLGDDADMMVPMFMDGDVGWAIGTLVESFIPDAITEREWYRYGFDDRRFMHPTTKEAVRIINRWFNEGLIFQEFAYGEAGTLMDDLVRLGVVGAQIANWDMPFRAGADQQIVTMREHRGPEANFITITPFPNDAGNRIMFAFPYADRQILLPQNNRNPVASLLYIDWLSRQSTRDFLAFGIEGVHHVVEPNGALRILPTDELPDNMIFAAVNNFDINPVANGFDLGDNERTVATLALAYAGIDASAIMEARSTSLNAARVWRTVVLRTIDAEEGMSTPLNEFRDTVLHNAVTASVDQFDTVWDTMYAQYLAMGGQAIINERDQAWVEAFGDVDFMPGWTGW
ncbi:MAG: extracellular solute-binding protein [Defluviitaleaceae bacterium]|nr:extracellular solute-binding protein [Defluviitaleaceae bacterium]